MGGHAFTSRADYFLVRSHILRVILAPHHSAVEVWRARPTIIRLSKGRLL